jgi:tetratricopeptide (TPR) repeat protein
MNGERYSRLLALSETGNDEGAIAGLRLLVSPSNEAEENAAILLTLGGCLERVGRTAEARKTLTEARVLAASDSWIHARALFFDARMDVGERNWRGALGKLEDINRQYSAVLEHPDQEDLREEVQRYTGMALYETGRAMEARTLLEQSSKIDYDRAKTLYYLGRCCYDLGDLDKAKESFVNALALDLDPMFQPSGHYILGLCYHWQGQEARAISEFEWCLEHDEQGLVAKWKTLTALVNSLKALGMDDKAKEYSKQIQQPI